MQNWKIKLTFLLVSHEHAIRQLISNRRKFLRQNKNPMKCVTLFVWDKSSCNFLFSDFNRSSSASSFFFSSISCADILCAATKKMNQHILAKDNLNLLFLVFACEATLVGLEFEDVLLSTLVHVVLFLLYVFLTTLQHQFLVFLFVANNVVSKKRYKRKIKKRELQKLQCESVPKRQ